jgi:hypothetical protein
VRCPATGSATQADEWVTLQLTVRHDGTASPLRFVDDRAQLGNATDLIADLEHRRLIVGDYLTDEARSVVASGQPP